jgi:hypothetical protein
MELNMHFTFEKNDSYSAVGKGKYKNIRFFHLDHNPSPFKQMQWLVNDSIVTTNWTIADESAVLNDGHGSQCTGHGSGDCTGLDQFSAACWYFAQSLSDRMSDDGSATNAGAAGTIPLGMIESAYGGTTIEQWLSVEAQLRCTNVTCHANSSIPYVFRSFVFPRKSKSSTRLSEEVFNNICLVQILCFHCRSLHSRQRARKRGAVGWYDSAVHQHDFDWVAVVSGARNAWQTSLCANMLRKYAPLIEYCARL